MAIDFTPGDAWKDFVDASRPVTFSRLESPWSATALHALRRPLRPGKSRPADDRTSRAESIWRVPRSEVEDELLIGDIVEEEDGRKWTILQIEVLSRLDTWQFRARDLVAYHGLYDYVDVERAEVTVAASGAQTIEWTTYKTGVPARWGRETLSDGESATVFLLERFEVDARHRIRRHDGAEFRPITCRLPDTPGEPVEVDVEPIIPNEGEG